MKAAIVEQPGVLVVRDIPCPKPGDYQVLCKMLYGATCSGTDWHLIENRMPRKVSYPIVLGHESIGEVIAVGRRVRNFREGDLVTRVGTVAMPEIGLNISWGGFCEFGIATDHWAMRDDGLPRAAWNRARVNQRLPRHIDPAAATMVITWRETLSYVRRMKLGAGQRVLILGTGGNGFAFAAHARNLGTAVVAMVGNPQREPVARSVGVTHLFDYANADLPGSIAAAGIEGFEVIIDAVGKRGQVDRVLPLLAPGGTVAIYGIDDYDQCAVNPRQAKGTFTIYQGGYDEEEAHEEVVTRLAAGSLDARPWLNLENPYPLDDIASAFAAVRLRREVKALIRLSSIRSER